MERLYVQRMVKELMKVNSNMAGDIIASNILTWLPIKTLLRFNSACKSWLWVISDPEFIEEYGKKKFNRHSFVATDSCSPGQSAHEHYINEFSKNFVKSVLNSEDVKEIFGLALGANYLDDIEGLLDLTCRYVADYIKDKSVEEVRELFNIVNDYTEEEEAEIRRENAWAFE